MGRLANLGRFVRVTVSVMRCSRFTVAMTRRTTGRAKVQSRSVRPTADTCGGVMFHALSGGDGRCSSVHGAALLLLTAPRPGVRALDREADPRWRLVGWRVILRRPARAADCTGSVRDESRPHTRLGASLSLTSLAQPARARRRDPSHCGENCSEDSRTIWIGRRKSGGDERKRASICSVAPRLAIYLLM